MTVTTLIIDNFNTENLQSNTFMGVVDGEFVYSEGSLEETDVIGGTRTFTHELLNNTFGLPSSSSLVLGGMVEVSALSNGSGVNSELTFSYNGGYNEEGEKLGLGGVDITLDDALNAFALDILFLDLPVDFTVTIEDLSGNIATGSLSGLTSSDVGTQTLEFSQFANFDNVDFTQVNAIEINLVGEESFDIIFDNFQLLSTVSTIGDFVFEDFNANGIQDAEDVGIEGVTVELLADSDGDGAIDDVVATTTTDASGFYEFGDLAPGVEFQVRFTAPEDFQFSPSQVGDDPTIDSNGELSDVIVLALSEFNDTIDVGLFQTASIGNFVFNDSNNNGIQDAEEVGISGVTVELLADIDGDGAIDDVFATTTTDSAGFYSFTGLTPGEEFQVRFTALEGFEFTIEGAGDDPRVDSDGPLSDVVVLSSGEFNDTIDAGLFSSDPDISEIEPNILKITIDSFNTPDQQISILGEGAEGPIEESGSFSPDEVIGGVRTFIHELSSNDFSLPTASELVIGGTGLFQVTGLSNGSGGNSELTLLYDEGGIGLGYGKGEDFTQGGTFNAFAFDLVFLDLPVDFTVSIQDLAGNTATGLLDLGPLNTGTETQLIEFSEFDNFENVDFTQVNSIQVDIVGPESFDIIFDNFYLLSTFSSIGDFVFLDEDIDGIQDEGEVGIEGIKVELLSDIDGDGAIDIEEVVATTTTDDQGFYEFTGLTPGVEFQVHFNVLESEVSEVFGFTPFQEGDDPTVDSDGPLSDVIVLELSEFNNTIDAGLFEGPLEPLGLPVPVGGIIIDSFNTEAVQINVFGTESEGSEQGSGSFSEDDVIGGIRTFTHELSSNDFSLPTSSELVIGSVVEVTGLSNGSGVNSELTLLYDQGGLGLGGGLGEDFTLGDTLDAFAFDLIALDLPVDFTVSIQDLTGNTAIGSLSGLTSSDLGLQIIEFSEFANFENVDFTQVNSIEVNLVGPDAFDIIFDNFQLVSTLSSSIGDFVFEDLDQDGIQDEGELGIFGVTVDLLADTDGDGAIDDIFATTTTDANGSYEFTDLPLGEEFQVRFTAPEDFEFSPSQVGDDFRVDSDGELSDIIVLGFSEYNDTIDAGLFPLEVVPAGDDMGSII